MNARRLHSALVAIGLLVTVLITGLLYARWTESRYIHALADRTFPSPVQGESFSPDLTQAIEGSVLQAEAFRQPDLLPIYGSSELIWRSYQGEFNGSQLFRDYPTGFALFPVGKPGTPPLVILQDLAAIGRDLQGKKVAISLSPSWLLHSSSDDHGFYAGNFSRLHAGELAFSTELSLDLKQAAARRMLQFPETLADDPLLKLALERLADGSPRSRVLYYATLPLGKLENLVLRLQDHWETLALIRSQPDLDPDVPRQTGQLDWSQLRSRAERISRLVAGKRTRKTPAQPSPDLTREDDKFLQTVRQSPVWTDVDLLMRGLVELGARPLILSQPLAGPYFDRLGVHQSVRDAFYGRFHEVTQPYGVPVVDFADHDEDRYFVVDARSHLSAEGWLYYDEMLDAFYHGASG
jgi:D-alanine transfer protein